MAAAAWSSSPIGSAGPRRPFGSGPRGCAPSSSRATSTPPAPVLRWRLDEHRCRNFYDKYSKTIGLPAASARLTMVFVFPIGASQLFGVHFEQMPGFARTFIVTPLAGAGYAVVFAGRALREMFRPPFEIKETARQLYEIGWRSLPLIAVSGFAVGIVLSMQTRASLERFGAELGAMKVTE